MTATAPPREAAAEPALPHGRRPKLDLWISFWFFGFFYTVFSLGVVLFGRITPPPRPDVTDLQVQVWFDQHSTMIQIGLVVLLVFSGGAAVSNGIIGYYMMRMSSGRVLAYAFIATMGVGAIPGFMLITVCWLVATFRPERDPALLHWLYDAGMLSYNGSLGCFTAAYAVLALAILYDKNRIFPKWFAYVCIWEVVTEVIATQMWFFDDGPFAWDGVVSFWIAVVVFTLWLGLLFPLLRNATIREPEDQTPLYDEADEPVGMSR